MGISYYSLPFPSVKGSLNLFLLRNIFNTGFLCFSVHFFLWTKLQVVIGPAPSV